MRTLYLILSFIFIFILFPTKIFSQYKFTSKDEEKFYYKIEEYYDNTEYDKILKNESKILKIFENKRDTVTCFMYSAIAEAYYLGNNDIQKALEYMKKEYDLASIINEKATIYPMVNLVNNIAALYNEIGKFSEVEPMYMKLLDINKKNGDQEEYIFTINSLLDFYSKTNNVSKGFQLLKDSRKIIKPNSYDDALHTKFLGDFYSINEEFTKAHNQYQMALNLFKVSGYYPSLEYVYALNDIGILYTNKSQYPLAEETYKEALTVLDRLDLDDLQTRTGLEYNLAQVYLKLGQFQNTLEILIRILESDKKVYGDRTFNVATTKTLVGDVFMESKKYTEAINTLLQAKEIYEELEESNSFEYIINLNNLMRAYIKNNNLVKAKEFQDLTLAKYKAMIKKTGNKDNLDYAIFLSNASELFMKINDLKTAKKYLLDAHDIRGSKFGKYKNRNHYYSLSAKKLALLFTMEKDYNKAIDYYSEAFEVYFNQINEIFPILSEDEKVNFYYNLFKPTFEQFNNFVIKYRINDSKLVTQMYNYQLITKGMILSASEKIRQTILNSGNEELITKFEEWTSTKEQLAILFGNTELSESERNTQIENLSLKAKNLEKEISSSSTEFTSNLVNLNVTWLDVQKKLKKGEAAVEILRFNNFNAEGSGEFTDEVYYVALIVTKDTKDKPEVVVLKNGKDLETKYLSGYRNSIRHNVVFHQEESYTNFWEPIYSKLKNIDKVFISPDGVYNQISIYTLKKPNTNIFSIDEIKIQVVSNTKNIIDFKDTKTTTSSFDKKSFLIGFPDYNLGGTIKKEDKEEITNKAKSIASQIAQENKNKRDISYITTDISGYKNDSLSQTDREERELEKSATTSKVNLKDVREILKKYIKSAPFDSLVGSKREINIIDSLMTSKKVKANIFLNDDAREENVKSIKDPKILHIATHGFFLEESKKNKDESSQSKYVSNPLLRSGLILAGANSYIADGEIKVSNKKFRDDGVLTAFEVMNMNLDKTELVVLSACETGLGKVKNGEGVYGLQRAFKIAGADAIIMSMWTVSDEATQELMSNFYEQWLKSGDKEEAFILAQKSIKAKWKAPYYWGAFIMVK